MGANQSESLTNSSAALTIRSSGPLRWAAVSSCASWQRPLTSDVSAHLKQSIVCFVLVLAGCAVPAQKFQSSLKELGGADVRDCGMVALHQSPQQSASCAALSLASHIPFQVGFQLQATDSQIWEGLVVSRSGIPRRVRFDSDPSGGALSPHARLVVEPCLSPVISVSASRAVSCASGR